MRAWSGREVEVAPKEKGVKPCPLCGESNYDYLLVNDQGGRAPPLQILAGAVEM